MNHTKIPWVRNTDNKSPGFTLNVITGCLNHIDGMCKGGNFHCYAHGLANGRLRETYCFNTNLAPLGVTGKSAIPPRMYNNPFYPRFWPERIDKARVQLAGSRSSRGVFPCSMGELFGAWVPENWQTEVMDLIKEFPWHRFYLLTKQYRKLQKWSPFPSNCYVGATVTNDATANIAWDALRYIKAPLKFLSIEPLLGMVSITPHDLLAAGIRWIIVGCQTKPTKFPKLEWVELIALNAGKAGIPVFYKNELDGFLPMDRLYRFGDGDLRQEMPEVKSGKEDQEKRQQAAVPRADVCGGA